MGRLRWQPGHPVPFGLAADLTAVGYELLELAIIVPLELSSQVATAKVAVVA